jgi:hypothetical protein
MNTYEKFHIQAPADPVTQAYYDNKKQLNGKIHEHWKQELSVHEFHN